jgi:hypothetical protein
MYRGDQQILVFKHVFASKKLRFLPFEFQPDSTGIERQSATLPIARLSLGRVSSLKAYEHVISTLS